MSNPGEADPTPIESLRQLAEWFAVGSKPRAAWSIGTEHEKFGFLWDGLRPLPYEGKASVLTMLEGLRDRFGWAPIMAARPPKTPAQR